MRWRERSRAALATADVGALLAACNRDGWVDVALPGGGTATLEREDLLVRTTAREGWAAAEGPAAVVVMATELSPELVAEGLVREVVHAVQAARKTLDLEFTQRIELSLCTPAAPLAEAIATHRDTIAAETLASVVLDVPIEGGTREEHDIDGHPLMITVRPLAAEGAA